jgi:hypothetical protein
MAVALFFLVVLVGAGIGITEHVLKQRAADARARREMVQRERQVRQNVANARRRVADVYAQGRRQMDETARQWQSPQQYSGDGSLESWQDW